MDVTADEGLEGLAVRELQIHFAAVTFDQAEGIELARVTLIEQRAEVTPVDIEAFSGSWLHANIGTLGRGLQRAPRVSNLSGCSATGEAERAEPLRDHHGTGFGILLQPLGDGGLERIQFAGTLPASGAARRRGQILGDGSAAR